MEELREEQAVPRWIKLSVLAVIFISLLIYGIIHLLEKRIVTYPEFAGAHKALAWRLNPMPAPADYVFQGQLENGNWKNLSLNHFQGKVILINFWASWCAPCIKELPSLNRLQAEYDKDKFEVVAISLDIAEDQNKARKLWQSLNLDALTLYREHSNIPVQQLAIAKFFVEAFPSSFLINEHGQILATLLGEAEWDSRAAYKVIDFAL